MKIFLQLLKKLVFCFIGIIILISLAMIGLNKRNFAISNDKLQKIISYYYADFEVQSEKGELQFALDKIYFKVVNIKLGKDRLIILQDFNLSFDLLNLTGHIDAKIVNSDLISLLSLRQNPENIVTVNQFSSQHHIICNGTIKADFNLFSLKEAELNLSSNNGWHDPKKDNLNKVSIKRFNLVADYKLEQILIKQFDLEYTNNLKTSLTASFTTSANNFVAAEIKAEINQLPIDYLAGFWPDGSFSALRNWIISNVSKGMVSKATGIFKLTKENCAANSLPKDSIDVSIEMQDMELKYLDDYAPISKIDGVLKIDGAGLYLKANKAETLGNSLEDVDLSLTFNDFLLTLNTKVSGDIAKFKQFIPKELSDDLLNYNVDCSSIKGRLNGILALSIPVFDEFKLAQLKLDIKADLRNVVIDKNGLIKFQKGSFEILNEVDKIKFKLSGEKALLLEFDIYHNLDQRHKNQINIEIEVDARDKILLKNTISLNNGIIKPKINLVGNTWKVEANLKDAEVCFLPLGYINPKSAAFLLECSGNVQNGMIESESCSINGRDVSGKIFFTYSMLEGQLTKLTLQNIKLGPNNFNMESLYDKKNFNYDLSASYLDLTNYSSEAFIVPNDDGPSSYSVSFKVNKMLMPNKNFLNKITGKISQIGKNPINIDLKGFANNENEKLVIVKIKKNGQDGYMLHGSPAAIFTQSFNIYNDIKKGEVWIEAYPKITEQGTSYQGAIRLEDFAFTNTSAFAKIIFGILSPLNSPKAIAQTLKGGSLQAESFNADLEYNQGIISIENGLIIGESYSIKLGGKINLNDKIIDIKGVYIPSTYGLNNLISNLPLLGKLLSGGKNSAFLGSNFSIKGDLKNPKISFSTLTSLTPGFIRNLFN